MGWPLKGRAGACGGTTYTQIALVILSLNTSGGSGVNAKAGSTATWGNLAHAAFPRYP